MRPESGEQSRGGYGQFDPCFPKRRNFHVGDVAACGGAGDTTFIRWVVTK
jgi:hypothetical protein